MSIESVMPSNHLILCRPLLLLPSIFPSIKVFSSESALPIRWPKYWSFSFSISSSNEYSPLLRETLLSALWPMCYEVFQSDCCQHYPNLLWMLGTVASNPSWWFFPQPLFPSSHKCADPYLRGGPLQIICFLESRVLKTIVLYMLSDLCVGCFRQEGNSGSCLSILVRGGNISHYIPFKHLQSVMTIGSNLRFLEFMKSPGNSDFFFQ